MYLRNSYVLSLAKDSRFVKRFQINKNFLKDFGANFYKLSKNIDFKAFKLILIYNFLII
ncbi:DNA polymerase III subunit delta [Streptococcus sanguinis SK1058]|nr:hypothetical protein HMPREF9392_1440 [Streptococcus sanguinis SK678]EGF21498.1 DNA polymerase III subunit delta [Streptococcus sanguinis SK1058]